MHGNCAQEGHRYLARPNNNMDTNGTNAQDKTNQTKTCQISSIMGQKQKETIKSVI